MTDEITAEELAEWVPSKLMSLEYLQSIYRDESQSMYTRIRAARDALPYENAKLVATAIIDGQSFAAKLERAITRSNGTKVIEAKVIAPPQPIAEEIEEIEPIIPVPDRRYRR
jgi:hypothetical protein